MGSHDKYRRSSSRSRRDRDPSPDEKKDRRRRSKSRDRGDDRNSSSSKRDSSRRRGEDPPKRSSTRDDYYEDSAPSTTSKSSKASRRKPPSPTAPSEDEEGDYGDDSMPNEYASQAQQAQGPPSAYGGYAPSSYAPSASGSVYGGQQCESFRRLRSRLPRARRRELNLHHPTRRSAAALQHSIAAALPRPSSSSLRSVGLGAPTSDFPSVGSSSAAARSATAVLLRSGWSSLSLPASLGADAATSAAVRLPAVSTQSTPMAERAAIAGRRPVARRCELAEDVVRPRSSAATDACD